MITTSTDVGFVCRSCQSNKIHSILSLGSTPLANSLLGAEQLQEPEQRYPLELVFCANCSLVQITETVPPEVLFRDYVYFSSFSETALRNAEDIVTRLIDRRGLNRTSFVAEVASNDGYLLQYYQRAGIPVLGIEPARNIAKIARNKGIETIEEFFGADLGAQLAAKNIQADVLHANNVFAHVADTNGFVEGIRHFLKPEGVAVIEAPYLKDTLDHTEFDQIYHEHLCYFSLTSVDRLMRRHELFVQDVEHLPIHGGTLRYFVQHLSSGTNPSRQAKMVLDSEQTWGVDNLHFYQSFGHKVESLRTSLLTLLRQLKQEGKRIAVYGASAKGSTLMNYYGIGREIVDYVVDRSTVKQGRYTPGTHLLITTPEKLLQDRPDYVLLLTWNFSDEILEQQAEYRRQGGRFIIPIPELKVV